MAFCWLSVYGNKSWPPGHWSLVWAEKYFYLFDQFGLYFNPSQGRQVFKLEEEVWTIRRRSCLSLSSLPLVSWMIILRHKNISLISSQ